jgi:hypothetical protein
MKTQLQSIHEETYSDGSKTLGVLLNYNEDQTFKESFTFIFNTEKKMYIFFSTIIDMIDYLMYGEMQGKTKVKRAYMEETVFDQHYDAHYINGKFTEVLIWI